MCTIIVRKNKKSSIANGNHLNFFGKKHKMPNYLPTVFLSGSNQEIQFIEAVAESIVYGIAEVYTKTFANGEELLSAMESRVQKANIFALFASAASISSHWVNFEISTARIEKIIRNDLEIRVYPAIPGEVVDVTALPPWMRKYWVAQIELTAQDIGRQLNHVLLHGIMAPRVFGRGANLDAADRLYARVLQEKGRAPNVFFFTGQPNIGRRTFARAILERTFHSKSLGGGPVISLNELTEPADLYRKVREKWLGPRHLKEIENEMSAFITLSQEEKISEIRKSLQHFSQLNEAVFLVSPRGFFDDSGMLEKWAIALLKAVEDFPRVRLIIVSNRQPKESDLQICTNVCHFHVVKLEDADVQTLVTHELTQQAVTPIPVSTQGLIAIGGHPVIARVYARLLERYGRQGFENNPRELFLVQDQILAEGLDYENLSEEEADILAVLSWAQSMNGDLLYRICNRKSPRQKESFFLSLQEMFLSSLVEINTDSYSISPMLRAIFRRKHGFNDTELLKSLSAELHLSWEKISLNSDDGLKLGSELIDLFVFMFSLEGKSLPGELRGLMLPSTLLNVMREIYDRAKAKDDKAFFEQIISWSQLADLSEDNTITERLIALKIRSLIRIQEFTLARAELDQINLRGWRTRYELEGFYFRAQQQFSDALVWYRKAWELAAKNPALLHEYATCLFRNGETAELRNLLVSQDSMIGRNAYLLDLKAQILANDGKFDEAEKCIATLRASPEDLGRSYKREALLVMKRDQDYQKAVDILDPIISQNIGRVTDLRQVRCVALAWARQYQKANEDVDFVAGRTSGRQNVPRLKAHIELSRGNWSAALKQYSQIPTPNNSDRLLWVRILEAKYDDAALPLQERQAAREESLRLRRQYGPANEFEI